MDLNSEKAVLFPHGLQPKEIDIYPDQNSEEKLFPLILTQQQTSQTNFQHQTYVPAQYGSVNVNNQQLDTTSNSMQGSSSSAVGFDISNSMNEVYGQGMNKYVPGPILQEMFSPDVQRHLQNLQCNEPASVITSDEKPRVMRDIVITKDPTEAQIQATKILEEEIGISKLFDEWKTLNLLDDPQYLSELYTDFPLICTDKDRIFSYFLKLYRTKYIDLIKKIPDSEKELIVKVAILVYSSEAALRPLIFNKPLETEIKSICERDPRTFGVKKSIHEQKGNPEEIKLNPIFDGIKLPDDPLNQKLLIKHPALTLNIIKEQPLLFKIGKIWDSGTSPLFSLLTTNIFRDMVGKYSTTLVGQKDVNKTKKGLRVEFKNPAILQITERIVKDISIYNGELPEKAVTWWMNVLDKPLDKHFNRINLKRENIQIDLRNPTEEIRKGNINMTSNMYFVAVKSSSIFDMTSVAEIASFSEPWLFLPLSVLNWSSSKRNFSDAETKKMKENYKFMNDYYDRITEELDAEINLLKRKDEQLKGLNEDIHSSKKPKVLLQSSDPPESNELHEDIDYSKQQDEALDRLNGEKSSKKPKVQLNSSHSQEAEELNEDDNSSKQQNEDLDGLYEDA